MISDNVLRKLAHMRMHAMRDYIIYGRRPGSRALVVWPHFWYHNNYTITYVLRSQAHDVHASMDKF